MTANESDVQLFTGESIINRRKIASVSRQDPPLSAIDTLATLCNVRTPSEIGLNGPVMASMHRASSEGIRELGSFEVLFGRDSLISALLVKEQHPNLLLSTVRTLAKYQGKNYDSSSEEEPGRIPHEVRQSHDPIAVEISRSNGWTWPYYGAIDTTPLFLVAMRELMTASRWESILFESTNAAIDWLIRRLENGNGLLVSMPSNPKGIENQVWKDSWDSFSGSDGKVGGPPCAPLLAQALAYEGCTAGAELLRILKPEDSRQNTLQAMAQNLREAVLGRFWIDRESRFGACLLMPTSMRSQELLTARTSDPGHLLVSDLLTRRSDLPYRNEVIRSLINDEMLCGGGIRTLSNLERRYRPTAYHNGSSWPWETTVIALALDKFGFHRLADALGTLVMRIYDQTGLFPEFVRGDSALEIKLNSEIIDIREADGRVNRICQPPQEIQAFTLCSILALKHREIHPKSQNERLTNDEKVLEDQLLQQMAYAGTTGELFM